MYQQLTEIRRATRDEGRAGRARCEGSATSASARSPDRAVHANGELNVMQWYIPFWSNYGCN